MATALHHLSDYDPATVPDASNMCFGIVVAEWNPDITGALLSGAMATLKQHGTLPENIHVKTVPGSFELIYGAHQMVLHGCYRVRECNPWRDSPLRLYLSRCNARHCPLECHTGNPRHLWPSHHQRPATST